MKNLLKQIVAGSLAGAVGAFAMRQAVLWWGSQVNNDPQRTVFGLDEEADVNSVQILANSLFHKTVSVKDAKQIALALHYGYGIGTGAAYAVLVDRAPKTSGGFGTGFGVFVWVFGDEIAVYALGASNPFEKKPDAHISAFAAHLLFGAVVEGCRRNLLT